MSLCSTLQSAHKPVRGQAGTLFALAGARSDEEALTTNVAVEEADWAGLDEEPLHAARAAEVSRKARRNLVIEFER
jgi:hypothetical protein